MSLSARSEPPGSAAGFAPFAVRVPASSANLGPGFDCVGLALNLFTTVRVRPAAQLELVPHGAALAGTPRDARNPVMRAFVLACERAGRPVPAVRLEVESEIPLARGLGSSAAALVAGLVAADTCLGGPLGRERLFELASELEGHPDNAGAALLGGAVIAASGESGLRYLRVTPPTRLGTLAVIPDTELLTEHARGVLPDSYSRQDAVFQLSHAALLGAALASGELELLAEATRDRLHQPYRAPLIPGLAPILEEAPRRGALAACLSGAGPTALVLFDQERADRDGLIEWLRAVLTQHRVPGRVVQLEVNVTGAVVSAL
ncbi:homoserine kinase [Deinobacterium chartae]|uniref:Homoserine kinase n=1 Tax=Deinobacterium chartae TaxID=521158 RepID=A0A841I2D7_9DEIO|nr:homoserine kinase [Deinobacterium chartae]MBB6099433.1 homoserine kinase [Deinobacterium chartae]